MFAGNSAFVAAMSNPASVICADKVFAINSYFSFSIKRKISTFPLATNVLRWPSIVPMARFLSDAISAIVFPASNRSKLCCFVLTFGTVCS